MTFEERVTAVRRVTGDSLTERQVAFVVTVMRHSGVCLGRHYCAYANLRYGKNMHLFFERLRELGYTVAHRCAHGRARLYRFQYKPLWSAIGEPNSRLRKFTSLPRAVERLMVLDAVLEDRRRTWLASEADKVQHFVEDAKLQLADLPALTFRGSDAVTVRYFPDRFPIAVPQDGDGYVFLYLITRAAPLDFRVFLERHAELLRSLRVWVIRVLAPLHFEKAITAYHAAFREHLAAPLRPSVADELRWYFEVRAAAQVDDRERFDYATDAFRTPRFRVLYKRWREQGASALSGILSTGLADAIDRGTGRFEGHVLPRRYRHLSKLVGTA